MSNNHPDLELVKHIVASITTNDDSCFEIERTVDERGVLLTLHIDSGYAGRVIGKGGNTAQAIRSLLRTLGALNSACYSLKVVVRDRDVQPA